MDTIEIIVKGCKKKINVTEKYAEGIYIVSNKELVKLNCTLLDIVCRKSLPDEETRKEITMCENCSLVTINNGFQYVIFEHTSREDLISM